ncbi:hypothetical protein CH54_3437 [Yersinia rochesterensis]|uniref:Uncharacterized protein n=1 Tax=Yersinia rochesterensis TaxID=1604335 RepID=A0ABN4FIB8_9GAMM|nr:hypothetical protein [Yersinia rochesterensis]AJI88106.1 hypothetical protein AW19_2349 [Yersinia frederiksenii Y225]CNH80621.1 Uncharacterised protein [Yersinia kristensenii]AIN19464.1 hypothetical protein DJ57_253 [Yersinia rochesterensis]AJJ37148.1 hypothetical protein CH54_3437 [Yersinia rochesterensis]CRY66960.1 Uncharacterised protein [Yersinia kristensenii]
MKPYIMNYSETITMKQSVAIQNTNILDVTTRTFTIETDDHDEILGLATIITERIENSDRDEISAYSTFQTNIVENSDKDEISCAGTMVTAVIENSDTDEYLLFSTMETRELEAADSEEISYLMSDSTIMTKVFEATDNDE